MTTRIRTAFLPGFAPELAVGVPAGRAARTPLSRGVVAAAGGRWWGADGRRAEPG